MKLFSPPKFVAPKPLHSGKKKTQMNGFKQSTDLMDDKNLTRVEQKHAVMHMGQLQFWTLNHVMKMCQSWLGMVSTGIQW